MRYYIPWNERTKLKRSVMQKVPQVLVGRFWKHYTKDGGIKRNFYCMICHSRFIFNTVFSKRYH